MGGLPALMYKSLLEVLSVLKGLFMVLGVGTFESC